MKTALLAARDAAQAAHDKNDVEAAETAAQEANKILTRLKERCANARATTELSDEDRAFLEEVNVELLVPDAQAWAREARYDADLTHENARRAKLVRSLTAKTYRGGRSLAVLGFFKGLSVAADQAGKNNLAQLPDPVRRAAETAGGLAVCPPLPDGSPDWVAIAAQMNSYSSQPPDWLRWSMGLLLLIGQQPTLALCEIDGLDPEAPLPFQTRGFQPPSAGLYLIRALIYRANGLPLSGAAEISHGLKQIEPTLQTSAPQVQAWIHLVSAVEFLSRDEREAGDRELAAALRADPESPLAAFLAGEKLLPDGSSAPTTESLDALIVKHGGDPWVAAKLRERARQVRDATGPLPPLYLDNRFLCELFLHQVTQSAVDSPAGAAILARIDAAKDAMRGIGEKPAAPQQAPESETGQPSQPDPSGTPVP